VVSYHDSTAGNNLPLSTARQDSEGLVVGKAVFLFNVPSVYIPSNHAISVGSLFLPPKGIKDVERVGLCTIVFTVVNGQSKSIELAFIFQHQHDTTTERFLLSSGDVFLVPQENTYRVQNHSTTTECHLTWVTILPDQSRATI
jgi:Mif2/CENP-C like